MNISRKEKILFSLNIILIMIGFFICHIYPRDYIIFIENIKPIHKYSIVMSLVVTLYAITLFNIDNNSKK
jgi:hypothetical protein